MNKIENTERYVKLYEAMKQAIPDDIRKMVETFKGSNEESKECVS